MQNHTKYMRRAMDLAGLGLGKVSPNPLVGCIIVHDEKIIGEGWHQEYGMPHAEVNAINSVQDKLLLAESMLYVNLEPCAHYGKTPPCTDLIISCGIKTVIVSNTDPNPLVKGRGVVKLKEAGIKVVEKIEEDLGLFLNRRFFTFHEKDRPYIILKWAQTKDKFIARVNHNSKWISNEKSRQLVHQYRAQEDAIMVGANTASHDDPELTVRLWKGRNPVRIVLDPNLRLSRKLQLFDGKVFTLCYNYKKDEEANGTHLIKCPQDGFLDAVWNDLRKRNIQSVLVEGGGKLLGSIIDSGQWDEARVFTSSKKFGAGLQAPDISTSPAEERIIAGDHLQTYYNSHAAN